MDRLGLVIATILALFLSKLDSGKANTLTSCSNVYSELSLLQFRYYTEIPLSPVNSQDLRICRPGMSCCSRDLERELVHQARHDFHTSLQTSTMYLKFHLSSSSDAFRTEFEDLLTYGKEKIQQHLRTSFTNIAIHMNSPIEDLFGSLTDYLNGIEVDIYSVVSRFFDALFPHIYMTHINPSVTRLDVRYRDCLSNQASVILPFGYAPQELAEELERSLTVARMFIRSVNLGLEVLNATENMDLTPKCMKALMKMRYCGQCQSLVGVPACQGFCFNVIKGCLANFMDLDLYWKDYVSAVVDLVRVSMTAEFDLQSAMYTLDQRVRTAINRAISEKAPIIQAVMITCGPPPVTRPSPYNDFAMNNPAALVPIAPNPAIPLDERLLQFVGSLDSSKSVFRDLPLLMCSQGNMATDSNQDCWNGDTRGAYLKPVVADGLVAQTNNPEVKLTSREVELLNALRLMDKLEHKTDFIDRFLSTTLIRPGEDSEWSGDGEWSGSGSGSGDFSGSGDYEYEWETTTPQFKLTTVKPKELDFSFEPSSSTPQTRRPVRPTRRLPYRPVTDTQPDPTPDKSQGGKVTPKPPSGGAVSLHTVAPLLTLAAILCSFLLHW